MSIQGINFIIMLIAIFIGYPTLCWIVEYKTEKEEKRGKKK